jgi:ribosome maturation factor RimP
MGEQPYTLEVTSPGVDRPLTEPRHYRRNVSRLVTLTLHEGAPLTGRIVRAAAADVTVEVPATKKAPARTEVVPYAAVARAVVQVEFSRPAGASGDETDEFDDTDQEH